MFFIKDFFKSNSANLVDYKLLKVIEALNKVKGNPTQLGVLNYQVNFIDPNTQIHLPLFVVEEKVPNIELLHKVLLINHFSYTKNPNFASRRIYLNKNEDTLSVNLIYDLNV